MSGSTALREGLVDVLMTGPLGLGWELLYLLAVS